MKTPHFADATVPTFLALGLSAWFSGCSLSTNALEEEADELIDDAENTIICDGMTLEELMNAVTISESCKVELESYLPQPENDFQEKIILLGQTEQEDGSLTVYLQGVDSSGIALTGDDWSALTVKVTVDGSAQVLEEGAFTVTAVGDLNGDLLSLGFVNDYSGSMSEADLEVTAEIEHDILSVFPEVFEGEVTLFSTEVAVTQRFSEDRQTLMDAVGYDDTFIRDLTALYDGMGTGLSSLIQRQRPLRLLVVATDGQENSSMAYSKDQLINTIANENVCVLILGSLFSDPDELSDFASGCGAYFYTPGYGELKTAVSEYVRSLGGLVEVTVPADARGEGQVQFEIGSLMATTR